MDKLSDGLKAQIKACKAELKSQNKVHGSSRVMPLHEWLPILMEEVGEVATEEQKMAKIRNKPMSESDKNKFGVVTISAAQELIQVAAVALQAAESIIEFSMLISGGGNEG